MSWYDAKSDCASRSNGWLVSLTSSTMNDIVTTNRPGGAGYYWIGGTCGASCAYHSGIWMWESGELWSYTKWASGEPNILGGNESCLHLLLSSGYWNDTTCSNSYQYICQVLPTLNKCPQGIYIYICIMFTKAIFIITVYNFSNIILILHI